jgi:hypothetical protein
MQFPIKLAQNANAIWPSPSSELQASAKAWAANLNAHLGQIWSKSPSTVDLHPTETRMDQLSKTNSPAASKPYVSAAREREREEEWRLQAPAAPPTSPLCSRSAFTAAVFSYSRRRAVA